MAVTVSIISIGCNSEGVEVSTTEVEINGRDINTYTFDGCEYVGSVIGSQGDLLTHKGNCKYCINRKREMIRSVLEEMFEDRE